MSDSSSNHRQHPPRPQKPRYLGTSVTHVDQMGLDAVGTSLKTGQPLLETPSPSDSRLGQRLPSQPQIDDSDLLTLPATTSLQSARPTFRAPFSDRDRDRLPLPDPMYQGWRTPSGTSVTGTSVTSLDSKKDRHDIIYRLELNDRGNTTFRYSLEPFRGLDPSDNPTRRDLAVMDLSSSVSGFWQRKRNNQLRDTFLKDPDQEPFEIGTDFVARSHTFYHIRIHSSRVLDVLRSLIRYYPSLGLQLHDPEVFFMYPYRVLVHYYVQLEEKLEECVGLFHEHDHTLPILAGPGLTGTTRMNRETHRDLSVVLGHLKPHYMKEIEPEVERHRRGVANFSSLWLLFRPGDTVFAKVKGQLHFFKVLTANRETDTAGESSGPWSITVWGLYFDGYLLKRQARRFKILEFHGERDIQKLPVKPITYLQPKDGDKQAFFKRLIERGRKYYEYVCEVPLYRRYSGPVNGDGGDHYVGDVIIDPAGYTRESSAAKHVPSNFEVMFGARVAEDDFGTVLPGDPPDYGGGPYSKLNDRRCEKGSWLEDDDECLLLPGHIQGYALGRKQWLAFDLDSFLVPDDEDRPWENLVIDPGEMLLVQSLAGKHRGSHIVPWTADFIPGKGQGQVVLLHGPPGVGKTMTVECIATQMGRPLLCLTVADIGTEETSVEGHLAKYLGLASKWGAIVLIDEAETFLTKRKEGDLSRNTLVTAFLRALEYYSGMIFLTTNEPGRIDDAISSRIHLAIEYNSLDKDKRQKIWLAHISQLQQQQDAHTWPREVPKIKLDQATVNFITSETGTTEVESLNLSGRDIRNAFQTAVKLARFDADRQARIDGREPPKEVRLKPHHFKQAMDTKFALKKVINRIHGMTEEERAQEAGIRRETVVQILDPMGNLPER